MRYGYGTNLARVLHTLRTPDLCQTKSIVKTACELFYGCVGTGYWSGPHLYRTRTIPIPYPQHSHVAAPDPYRTPSIRDEKETQKSMDLKLKNKGCLESRHRKHARRPKTHSESRMFDAQDMRRPLPAASFPRCKAAGCENRAWDMDASCQFAAVGSTVLGTASMPFGFCCRSELAISPNLGFPFKPKMAPRSHVIG